MQALKKVSDPTKHLRGIHNEIAFPCSVLGCGRVGAKGCVRQKRLLKHHPAAHLDVLLLPAGGLPTEPEVLTHYSNGQPEITLEGGSHSRTR
ncbi:uncharacterized protein BCR38DRAFT_21858 [Pseudomassariella vexata]|uniref:C2H2-type domain-containing protein n=1 Tax=Pseudomassariella vexata TaxID=1141098 RepID=A0A1Y2EJW3_9PEZI|nr:uncharacterized protein BCR38DRAFT_21858 [Pseudomassariella vexata]ORY71841.1 hypothetical protein BCR38DRAFT_21858 [Pseudomassariella vexata]